jgi:diguanylate cyclase (GGDEF)-like protein/PAS domain S-box-containing protein
VPDGNVSEVSEERRVADLFRPEDPLFQALIENSSDMYSVTESTTEGRRIRYVSPSIRSVLGYEAEEMLGLDPAVFAADQVTWPAQLRSLLLGPGETSPPIEIAARHRDGSIRWLEVRMTNLIHDPVVRGTVTNMRDITARKLAEEELARTRALADSVLETAQDAYIQVYEDGRIAAWNRQAEHVFGWSRDEALGRNLDDLILPEHDEATFRERISPAAPGPDPPGAAAVAHVEVTALRRDGTEFPAEVTSWTTLGHDGVRCNAFVRDITERWALERQIAHKALHDELTGLPNRTLLADSLTRALKRATRARTLVAVLFCDLDQFKLINDSLGHSVGDRLLCSIADRLKQSIRSEDTIGRFGGDEFVIVFDALTSELEASESAERVLSAFRQPFMVDDHGLFVTASIGLAVGTATSDAEHLLADADAAMYRAKEKGRARLEHFDATLRRSVEQRHELQQALSLALECDELVLHYQPVVCLATGAIVGAEALLRWRRPGQGLVGPSEFLALASDTGLLGPISEWVLETACRQLQRWNEAVPAHPMTMSVNVSSRRLATTTLLSSLTRALELSGCHPGDLTLELTETAMMADLKALRPGLDDLVSTGVHLAVDDFGTGQASLGSLRQFPVDTLKIHPSFVANLGIDPYDTALISAISTMASMLRHTVVAKGVETGDQARRLRGHRCALAQGYFFSRPLPADRFLELLNDGARFDIDVDVG